MQSRCRATKIFKGKGKNGRAREEGERRDGRHEAKGRQSLGCCVVVVSYRFTCNRLFRRFYRGTRRLGPRARYPEEKNSFHPPLRPLPRVELKVSQGLLSTHQASRELRLIFFSSRESVQLQPLTERRRHLVKHPSPLLALKIAELLKVNLLHTRIRGGRIGFKMEKVNLLDEEWNKVEKFRQFLSWRKAPNRRNNYIIGLSSEKIISRISPIKSYQFSTCIKYFRSKYSDRDFPERNILNIKQGQSQRQFHASYKVYEITPEESPFFFCAGWDKFCPTSTTKLRQWKTLRFIGDLYVDNFSRNLHRCQSSVPPCGLSYFTPSLPREMLIYTITGSTTSSAPST